MSLLKVLPLRLRRDFLKVALVAGIGVTKADQVIEAVRQVGGGKGKGSGISAHKITVGKQRIHARNFYNAMGKLDTSNYRKLSDSNKTQVLKHGIQKFTEMYIPRAQQGRLDAKGLETNRKIGALEGMRRAALSKAKGFETGSKEWRAATHVAISLQERARMAFGGTKLIGVPTKRWAWEK